MEKKRKFRDFLPLTLIFLFFTALFGILNLIWGPLPVYIVLLSGNLVLFAATWISYLIYRNALLNSNVHAFLRALYGGMLVKMAMGMAAILLYILLAREKISKPGIFGCFGLYFLYTYMEVKILMRSSKQQKNA